MTSPSGVGTLVGTLVGGRDVVGAAVEGTDVGANERKVGSDGFEKVLIGTRGARETFLRGRKGRAA